MNTVPTFFDTPAKIAALRAEALRWVGTPFFANSEACGRDGGADCVRLLRGINTHLGVIAGLDIPPQIMDWGDHAARSLLIEAFETWPVLVARFRRVFGDEQRGVVDPAAVAIPGDVLCFNGGRVPHHGGQMLDGGEFIHTLKPEGAYVMKLGARVRGWRIIGQIHAIYRPVPLP